MNLTEKIKEIIEDSGFDYYEKNRTLYTTCPSCGEDDKFSILKENGACICYRGSCDFGRKWFVDWISLTNNVPYAEAKKLLYGVKTVGEDRLLKVSLGDNLTDQPDEELLDELEWPPKGFELIDHPDCQDGANYLQNRGIPLQMAKYYDIRYSPWFRRVVLPIHMGGKNYGWQARAIDKVEPQDRMRNNEGFRRDRLIMFMDRITDCNHMILCEGPFDALKFHKLGGNVATLGKAIADKQVELINNSGIDTLYMALDDDAVQEMKDLRKKINPEINVKLLTVPTIAIERCESQGRKADFGECTFDECVEAFNNAKDFGLRHLLINLK